MHFGLTEEQQLLQETARRRSSPSTARPSRPRSGTRPSAFPAELWERMAELGWFSLPYPEAWGGGGGGARRALPARRGARPRQPRRGHGLRRHVHPRPGHLPVRHRRAARAVPRRAARRDATGSRWRSPSPTPAPTSPRSARTAVDARRPLRGQRPEDVVHRRRAARER